MMKPDENIGEKCLVIRADAGTRIGNGHVMRCLALAQAWQDTGGDVLFVAAGGMPNLEDRLKSEGMRVVTPAVRPGSRDDAIQTAKLCRDAGAEWLVVDGYHFDAAYQRTIKETGLRLLFIDDNGDSGFYCADIVLNQNLHADEGFYTEREPYTRLLLGTRYVLLRREFLKWRGWKRTILQSARRMLVTMGGADPDNLTLKVVDAVAMLNAHDLEVKVVVGPSNPNAAALNNRVASLPSTLNLIPATDNMADLMAWADMAVSAGGTTCWEAAFMGLPEAVIVLAANQRNLTDKLHALGSIVTLGWHSSVTVSEISEALQTLVFDSEGRRSMSEKGRDMVDGGGVNRVLAFMEGSAQTQASGFCLHLRRARVEDADLLRVWADDPEVRGNSFHPESIGKERHMAWYREKLASPDSMILIAESDHVPVAQIRYDRFHMDGIDTAEIGFSVARRYRGKGLGARVLTSSYGAACKVLGVTRVRGTVFSSNEASSHAFANAGFKCVEEKRIAGKFCRIFEKECVKPAEEDS